MKRAVLVLLLLVIGCSSPEARRTRGGDAGADPGNRNADVELHGGAEPYHDTPCRTTDALCRVAPR